MTTNSCQSANLFNPFASFTRRARGGLWLLAWLGGCGAPAWGQTAFLDFNTVGQYTNNFNPWNDSTGANGGNYCFMESLYAGVGGSGGVSVFQSTDTTAAYKSGSWDFSTNGATLLLSTFIKANGQTSGNKVQFGILNVNNNGLNANAGVAFESFRFIPSATTWSLREQYRTTNTLFETTLGNVSYTVGHWYKFFIALTNTSPSGTYNAACAIYDFGTNGLSPGTNIVTFSTLQVHTTPQDIATNTAVWPALRAWQNAGIDAWDNFLVYTPRSRPVITQGLTNTTVAAGKTVTFLALADGPGTISYAWYTNHLLAAGASGITYTTPPINTGYTNIMVVAANANGSTTNSAAITVFIPALPVITNSPATGIAPTTATLGGQVVSTGGDPPTVTLYYGTADGGTNAGAWAHSIGLGVQTGAFAQTVTGLAQGTTYYFTAQAVNAAGTAWATPSQTFNTPVVTVATVANLPATNVEATLATLNGEVLATGGDAPVVTLYYGPSDGGTSPGAWAQSVNLGLQTGVFGQTVTGLSANTPYFYTVAAVNAAGTAWATPSQTFTTQATNTPSSAVAVLTHHNDNARTGMNLKETILNTNNVNTNQFGLFYKRTLDDQVYAQPLVMANVNVLGRGTHNLVIVATVNDSVYAFDADDPSVSAPYWQVSFLGPNAVAPRNTDMTGACGGGYVDFSGNMGIVGTPVIDAVSQTLYLVVRTKENGSTFVQRLHALDVSSGAERPNSPVIITAVYPGTGSGNVGGFITFDPQRQNQRPGLALVNGVVYISWASHCDWGPYHGWVIGYDETTLQRVVVYMDSANGANAGIWMSGQAPAADTNGNLYLSTGNGTVDTSATINRGESFLKLTRNGTNFTVASWFTPYNWQALESGDVDLGSGGMLLIPGTTLAFSGGKQGVVYLVNRDNMGGLSGSPTADTNVVQTFQVTTDEVHGGAVWWDSPSASYGYIWPSSTFLQQYQFDRAAGMFVLPSYAQSPTAAPNGQPGGLLALSANGTNAGSGILWASHQLVGDANQMVRPGILHAYDAQNVAHELWNSQQLTARDSVGNFAKFVPPTVANGKVYLATFSSNLNVYGLLPSALPPQLSVRPPNLAFGPVVVGQARTQSFQVVNSGGQTLTGTAAAASPFSITGGSPFSLSTGQTGLVQVSFSPGSASAFSNVVVFTSNAGNSTNTVTGTGVTPAHLAVSPASLDFGTVAVGANAQASFVLTNLGGAALTNGTAIVNGGPFTLLSGTPFALPGSGSTNLLVRFAPGSAASFSNVVLFASDGGNSTNALLGTGALVPIPSFAGSPTNGTWPLNVSFTDSSTGTITNRFWDFGDSVTTNTTVAGLAHTYGGVGTNTVSLTVSGPVGTNTLTRPAYILVTNLPPVTLAIEFTNNQVKLTWPLGTLQSAGLVTGPYTNVPSATSPYLVTPSEATRFFRVQVR